MLQQLPETGVARERRWGSLVPSVALHAAIITAVAFAQAGGVEAPKPSFHVDTIVFQSPIQQDHPVGSGGSSRGASSVNQTPTLPQLDFDPATIPETHMPTIWPSSNDSINIGGPLTDGSGGTLTSTPGTIIGEATADDPVRVRVESVPRYPAALRALGVEGAVEMEFVVDTTGHADLATARVITSPDERFTAAVRQALRDARFVPGRYQGRAVRTIVRRAFRFELRDDR